MLKWPILFVLLLSLCTFCACDYTTPKKSSPTLTEGESLLPPSAEPAKEEGIVEEPLAEEKPPLVEEELPLVESPFLPPGVTLPELGEVWRPHFPPGIKLPAFGEKIRPSLPPGVTLPAPGGKIMVPDADQFPELRVVYLKPSRTKVYRVTDYPNNHIKDDFIEADIKYLGNDEWELEIDFDCTGSDCKNETLIEALYFPSMTTRYLLSGCDGKPTREFPLVECRQDSECSQDGSNTSYCVPREPLEKGDLGECDSDHPCPTEQSCGANGRCFAYGRCGECDSAHACPGGQVCDAHGRCADECLSNIYYYYPKGTGFRIPAVDSNLDFEWETYDDFISSARSYQNPFYKRSYRGRVYSGGASMPFVIMADKERSMLVAAANWPPKDVVPAFSAQRLELGYYSDGGHKEQINYYPIFRHNIGWPCYGEFCLDGFVPKQGEGPQTYRAIISEQSLSNTAENGLKPWHLAVDKYRSWLDSHMPEFRYPEWIRKTNIIYAPPSLGSYSNESLKAYVIDKIETHPEISWILFWGKDCDHGLNSDGKAKCYLKIEPERTRDLHDRYLEKIYGQSDGSKYSFYDYTQKWRNQGRHVGYYTNPAPDYWADRIEYRIDKNKGYSYLKGYIEHNMEHYRTNAIYIDILGAHPGPVKEVMRLFEIVDFDDAIFGPRQHSTPIIPDSTLYEGLVDVFPGVGLSDGDLQNPTGVRQWSHGSTDRRGDDSIRGCATAAAYPTMAPPNHVCRFTDRAIAFPELGFYALPGRIITLGPHNNSGFFSFNNTPWNSLAHRLAFLLGANSTIMSITAAHYSYIDELRKAALWAEPSNDFQRPRFMDKRGLAVSNNSSDSNNGFYAYKFVRENGDILLTVDDWDGGGGKILVQANSGNVEVNIQPLQGNAGRMCIIEIDNSFNQRPYCCTVRKSTNGENIVCP